MSKMATRWDALLGIAIGKATALWAIAGVYTLSANCVLAQITPDATLPNNSIVNINGNTFNITGGTQAGTNLFHSFQEFSVRTGSGAFFNNTVDIQNIISRVTGGSISNIDGLIRTLGTANLFLINPNGIVFGQNARLEIGGSFFASTASSLKFADGTEFRTNGTQTTPLLTISVPLGLQFGANPGKIQVQGDGQGRRTTTNLIDTTNALWLGANQTLGLVGGDLELLGGTLKSTGGRIELGSVGSESLVGLVPAANGWILDYSGVQNFRDIELSQRATVDASGIGGGNVRVQGRQITLKQGSQIEASTLGFQSGETSGGTLEVTGIESIQLDGSGATYPTRLVTLVYPGANGKGGNINVTSSSVSLTDGAELSASTFGQGDAGSVLVQAKDSVSAARNSGIFSTVQRGAVGNGGDVNINAATLSLNDGAQLGTFVREASSNLSAGKGEAGNVNVNVTGEVTIAGVKDGSSGIFSYLGSGAIGKGGNINVTSGSVSLTDGALVDTSTYGQGDAGNILVQAKDSVSAARNSGIFSTVQRGAVGNGGDININAPILSLKDGGALATFVREPSDNQPAGQRQAGNVNVNVTGAVTIAGVKDGFASGIISRLGSGAIGKGGNINVTSGSFSLTDGAFLEASTYGQGDAGSILVQAKDSVSAADSTIFSNVESGGVGKGGEVNINGATLSLFDGGQLGTFVRGASDNQPAGQGQAGNVNVNVTGALTITGVKDRRTGIFSDLETGAIGKGGNINITSGSVSLTDGAELIASTAGQGDAGSVFVQAKDSVSAAGNSYIFSNVENGGVGKGGEVNINGATLSLFDGGRLGTFVRRASDNQPAGQGQAGNVNVNVTGAVTIAGVKDGFFSGIISELGSGAIGKGGNINVTAGSFSLTDGAYLEASTRGQGDAGSILVQAKDSVSAAGTSLIFSNVENGGVGKGGEVNINGATLSLFDGGQLGTFVRGASNNQPAGQGQAGNVNVNVTGALTIAGKDKDGSSGIFSSLGSGAIGKGGNINITSGSVFLTDGASLEASTRGQGDAGSILVQAKDSVSAAGTSLIFSDVEYGAVGKGGDVNINAATLSLKDGAQLSTSVRGASSTQPAGQGQAGNVNVNVTGAVTIAGMKDGPSGIFSYLGRGAIGKGGNINVTSGSVSLTDGARLNASTFGQGDAGDIEVTARQIRLDNGARFNAESASGNGGNINLQVGDLLLLRRGSFISATAGTDKLGGNGGNITINAQSGFIVSAPNENSDITANAFNGSGGKIDINSLGIFNFTQRSREDLVRELGTDNPNELNPQQLPTNDITAISQTNPTLSGQITINTPDADQSLGLVELPIVLTDTSNFIADTGCDAIASTDSDTDKSKFTNTGRGGLPPSPYEPLSTDVVWLDTRLSAITTQQQRSQGSAAKPPSKSNVVKIVPATGWVFDGKGNVTLISNASNANSLETTPAKCGKQ